MDKPRSKQDHERPLVVKSSLRSQLHTTGTFSQGVFLDSDWAYTDRVMTISRLSAGNGYAYYTAVTVSADQRRSKDQELGDYYLETGTPEGQWMGRGAAELGVEGHVSEEQMRALFGDGLHPDADRMIAELVGNGMSAERAVDSVRLGRRFARFESPENELAQAISTAEAVKGGELGRALTPDESQAIRMRCAGVMFHDRHGRSGAPHEVAKLMATELSKGHNAVAGFDLTFSAPKSLSVAWAAADAPHAEALEAAHERAISGTIDFLEREVVRTRTGAGGLALHTTAGLVATRFRHWESREGDPQLHDHVVIANRVKLIEADGRERWLSIDSRSLFKGTMNASSVYNRILADELKREGFTLRERTSPSGLHRGMELACVSDKQLEEFSTRSVAIADRTNVLVGEYVAQHGRQPATKELLAIRQQATLETRTPKSQAVTRDELRSTWKEQMGDEGERLRLRVAAVIDSPGKTFGEVNGHVNVERVAHSIIDELSSKQSTWTKNHVETRLNIWAASQEFVVDRGTMGELVDVALHRAGFAIAPTLPVPAHPELINPDGSSIYQSRAATIFTSSSVLEAEDALVRAARDISLPAVSEAKFEQALRTHDGPLNQGQIDLAHQVVCSEHTVTVGIGPAGTGKTSAMKLAVDAAATAGVTTHGITVSAAAADQLEQSTGMPSTTIAKWLHDLDTGRGHVDAGDIIIIDEAGMVSARDLARVTAKASATGAFVRLIGDDRQLQAIGSGGSLKMLAAEVGAVRLDQVHRFHIEAEAAASLELREHGDVSWYITAERVHGGTHTNVLSSVVNGWAADEAKGSTSLMMAGSNNTVATLNQMAQDRLVADGIVSRAATVELADGTSAGVGDRIITRRNDRRNSTSTGAGFVKNGDTWTISAITAGGAVTASDQLGRQVTLQADYVATATGLGYATTVHRAQGQTVDHARLVIDSSTTREALYVGLTRGRHSNEVYAVTDGTSAADTLRASAANVGQAVSARELIDQAQREVGHPAHLVRILGDMQQRADHHRYETVIRDSVPQLAAQLLGSEKCNRLLTVLGTAEDRGFTPQRILSLTAGELPEGKGDPTGLIAWRITNHLTRSADIEHSGTHRPMRDVLAGPLQEMAQSAQQQKAAALEGVRAASLGEAAQPVRLRDGRDVPAWLDRPHGILSDDQLRRDLHRERSSLTTLNGAINETQEVGRDLQRDVRRATPGSDEKNALDRRLDRLDGRIDRLRDERSDKLRNLSTLHDETRIRGKLTSKDWFVEQVQRDGAKTIGTQIGGDVDAARDRWRTASDLQRGLWVETQARRFDPDLTINQRPSGSPAWAVPGRGLSDPAMPASWREPLQTMAANVSKAINERGAALALEPPAWATRYLGSVPEPDTALRARWQDLAGQIETWRGLTDHTDITKALPAPSRSRDASGQPVRDLHVLHAAAADLRRDQIISPEPRPQSRPRTPLRDRTPVLVSARPTVQPGQQPHPKAAAFTQPGRGASATPLHTVAAPAAEREVVARITQPVKQRFNVAPIRQWLTERSRVAKDIGALQQRLMGLEKGPLQRGESLSTRLRETRTIKSSVAAKSQDLARLEKQGPQPVQSNVRSILTQVREQLAQRRAQSQPVAAPQKPLSPIDAIRNLAAQKSHEQQRAKTRNPQRSEPKRNRGHER